MNPRATQRKREYRSSREEEFVRHLRTAVEQDKHLVAVLGDFYPGVARSRFEEGERRTGLLEEGDSLEHVSKLERGSDFCIKRMDTLGLTFSLKVAHIPRSHGVQGWPLIQEVLPMAEPLCLLLLLLPNQVDDVLFTSRLRRHGQTQAVRLGHGDLPVDHAGQQIIDHVVGEADEGVKSSGAPKRLPLPLFGVSDLAAHQLN